MPEPFDTNEYIRSLHRGFPTRDASEFIMIDGRANPYLRRCTNWLLAEGYIAYDRVKSESESEEQWTVLFYRITDAGRAILATKQTEGAL